MVIGPNHTEFQAQVTDLMTMLGWKFLHVRKSIGKGRQWQTTTNRTGWPDLFGWHPAHGFAGIELKVGPDTATVEQLAVLEELKAAGAQTMVAYPEDLDALKRLLRGAR